MTKSIRHHTPTHAAEVLGIPVAQVIEMFMDRPGVMLTPSKFIYPDRPAPSKRHRTQPRRTSRVERVELRISESALLKVIADASLGGEYYAEAKAEIKAGTLSPLASMRISDSALEEAKQELAR